MSLGPKTVEYLLLIVILYNKYNKKFRFPKIKVPFMGTLVIFIYIHMKVCKYCKNSFDFEKPKQFGAHLTNCKDNPKKLERDINSKKKKLFTLLCICGTEFSVECTQEKFYKSDHNKFCSRSCANRRVLTNETKIKIGKKLTKEKNIIISKCLTCEIGIEHTENKKRKFCSYSCSTIYKNKNGQARRAGLKSCENQSKRSKNEILFSEYCQSNFSNVLFNEPIFNGWDADIIIQDLKIAVLWNGVWHYKKITQKHSLLQVQNRDKIKVEEISKKGYIPYVIQDMGKFNKEKVDQEWSKFVSWISEKYDYSI
jgi:hypothetical protein